MPRPKKGRKICCLPHSRAFAPLGVECRREEAVVLALDEYETIRLIDREGLTQEACAGYMEIARTTVQQIYNAARGKLAAALVEGRPLLIEGGEYRLCDGRERFCACGGCLKHREAKGDA